MNVNIPSSIAIFLSILFGSGCLPSPSPANLPGIVDQQEEGANPKQESQPATVDEAGKKEAESQETSANDPSDEAQDSKTTEDEAVELAENQMALFDGKTLDGWEITNFGGEGDCKVIDGVLVIEEGYPISGLTSTLEALPKTNFEIELEARKTSGIDFFVGLTFPVEDSHCTFIVGGWAGSVVGLSCVDEKDASSNETRKLMKFEKDQWYRIKVRVTPERITTWIDGQQICDQLLEGHKISLRNETLPSRPLGICNFETRTEIKNFVLTKLKD